MEQRTSSVKGKSALITGSAAGIGYAMAQALARQGCNIVLHGIESEDSVQAQRAALAREHGVKVSYLRTDLSDPNAIDRMMGVIRDQHGGVDILVNNAVCRHFSAASEFPVEKWDLALAVNLSAAFHTIRLSLPDMRARGWGRIFNMTSVYGMRAVPNRIDYVTTKTALIGMTRAIALETINEGITCNALCPGTVLSPASDGRIRDLMQEAGLNRDEATRRFLTAKQPTQRFIDPAHVAELMLFLCGPAGSDITGTVLPVEGGWLAG